MDHFIQNVSKNQDQHFRVMLRCTKKPEDCLVSSHKIRVSIVINQSEFELPEYLLLYYLVTCRKFVTNFIIYVISPIILFNVMFENHQKKKNP
ncbi:hypothetical protein DERP_004833 [Dermatophagoides pteronyssinus]|uniref:Uncharacterized protein n=1 Tax=Dermatophagoides pteronyssinus TaxID=6956 RepID=A0ABQ8JSM8_DERPT|nr:hypothetical protein DERP_004833 [Dermatophagoides pteronyssinus]